MPPESRVNVFKAIKNYSRCEFKHAVSLLYVFWSNKTRVSTALGVIIVEVINGAITICDSADSSATDVSMQSIEICCEFGSCLVFLSCL